MLSDRELLALAKKQLGLEPEEYTDDDVPAAYLEELKAHLEDAPNDTNFSVELQAPDGRFVVCHEDGCDGEFVELWARPVAGGGRRDGFGSLSAYRSHAQLHPTHSAIRDSRVEAEAVAHSAVVAPTNVPSKTRSRPRPRPLHSAPLKKENTAPTTLASPVASSTRFMNSTPVKTEQTDSLSMSMTSVSSATTLPRKRKRKSEPMPLVKREPVNEVIDLSQDVEFIDLSSEPEFIDLTEDEPKRTPKRVKVKHEDDIVMKPLDLVNQRTPVTLPTSSAVGDVDDIRESLMDIQRQITSINAQIMRVRRKTNPSKADLTRLKTLQSRAAALEASKAQQNNLLPTLSRTHAEDVKPLLLAAKLKAERSEATIPQTPARVKPEPQASGSNVKLPPVATPAMKPPAAKINVNVRATPAPEPQPVASGSKAAALAEADNPFFPQHFPINPHLNPIPDDAYDEDAYDEDGDFRGMGKDKFAGPVAKADDIKQFLLAAGNAEQFNGDATLDEAVKKLDLPDIFTPLPGMEIALMPHQAIGVAWMLEKERSRDSGGCLADEMGLGKTVQTIATIVMNKPKKGVMKPTLIIAPVALLDQWQMEIEMKTNCGFKCLIYHGSSKPKKKEDVIKYDIVLTSYSTVSHEWPDPEEDVRREKKMKKKKTKKDKGDDFIVEDDDDRDWTKNFNKRKPPGLLLTIDWHRIVLDEGHNVRSRKTRVSRAVTQLDAIYRWVLTGTPIMNSLTDAYGILRFLRIRPWYDWQQFNVSIAKRERKDPQAAVHCLQAIYKTMQLRRTKETKMAGKRLIELPPIKVELTKLEFTAEERAVEKQTQAVFNNFLRAGTVLKNFRQVLVMLLRLRQICSHASLIQENGKAFIVLDEDDEGLSVEAGTELARARKLVSDNFVANMKHKRKQFALQRIAAEKESADAAVEEEECPICFDSLTLADAIVSPCTHIFCRDCILNVLNQARAEDPNEPRKLKAEERECPTCRSAISKDKIFSLSAFEPTDGDLIEATAPKEEPVVAAEKRFVQVDSDIEMLDDEEATPTKKDTKGKGKAKARPSKTRRSDAYDSEDDEEHTDLDDGLSDFIADDDEDEYEEQQAQRRLRKRLGKKRVMVIESEDESDVEEVLFGKPKFAHLPKEEIKLMPKFLPSTKMKHMMQLIMHWNKEHQDEKILVISQWTQALELVSDFLTENGNLHVKYQGDMNRKKRDAAVRVFMAKEKAQIMLMSTKCGGVGLNLTRANRVICLDLAWSEAVENQAWSRVHRLGQTRDVVIQRLVIAQTVEDRILALQLRKRALADGSLGEGTGKKIGSLTVKELTTLFGL
ncbi:hypothetical protein FA95DRAFT_1605864 [Auriscalpium vulgare]|uniref:Uncharacterized protein n=1 Tax=Auriscalpium vulgare TaxID=40419 RepID=A0ACB8RUL3_9AGAM|nr:hypothetical protein FA95DRAFT_1605864 [Auriscalpium vulgare]